MYFHRPGRTALAVSKTASRVLGESTAKRLLTGACASGAGARARSSALVTVSTPRMAVKTTTLRCDFFTADPTGKEVTGDALVTSGICRPRPIKPATRTCLKGISGNERENVQPKSM